MLPAAGSAALAAVYAGWGVRVARRERLRPVWRLGPLIGLLHLLAPAARTWGRLRARRPYATPGTGSSWWPLRSVGRGLFLMEGVAEVGREAFLDGLRDRLWNARLRPRAPSVWDEADVTCDSALFWRARMVSYEGWGTLYLRLVRRPRFARLVIPALGVACASLWSPIVAAGAAVGLLAIGGFDPMYRASGDDVDVCWKLLDRGYEIRFHPSALVWHHRKYSVRAFWGQ